ncbi:hypothetical protein AB0B31_01515 [Catellatospora citrea]
MNAEQVPTVRSLSFGVRLELSLGDGIAHVTTHTLSIRNPRRRFHPTW